MLKFTNQITDTKDVFKKLGINNTTLNSSQKLFLNEKDI